ncbi:hypothetical protein [Aliterella atlantica]|uniref:hypothetical protein n=1 Tax=Aliterella atlantica TaxID=1827278 RepID=UPI00069827C2|nr:hypothetical protein [Aliterella atlantica]
MLKTSTTTLIGIIALSITGCGSSDNPQSASPVSSPPPVAVSPSPVKPQPPIIAQNPSGTAYLAPSLIQPTNANQRVKQVAKGRRDPFAALFAPVTTPIPVSVAPPNSQTGAAPTNSSSNNNSQQASSNTSTNRSSGSSRRQPNSTVAARNSGSANNPRSSNPNRVSVGTQSRPNQTTPSDTTSPLNPPPPSSLPGNNLPPAPPVQLAPELAQNVTVMGVIQIGESTQAIVQVPNEPTSRYVQVGQRLSNGQVLVKRIEMNEGAEPLVVLEQFGVEVAKAVGEQPANQNNGQTSPTAALPSSVPENPVTQAVNPSLIPQNIITTQAVNPSLVPQNITTDALSVPPPPNTPAVEAN